MAASLTVILSGATGHAANVVASNESDPYPIALADGTPVPAGNGFVSVGTFDLADQQIRAAMDSQANLDAVTAVFSEFGTSSVFGVAGEGGVFSTVFEAAITTGDMFDGMAIFIVGGNGSDMASSDQLWIFKSGETFAADGVDEFSARIELDAEFQAGAELLGSPDSIFLPGAGDNFDGSRMVSLVPEPGVVGMSALLGVALLLRRIR